MTAKILEKKLLILDLDETLIHSETMRQGESAGNFDFIFTVPADDNYDQDEVSPNLPSLTARTTACMSDHIARSFFRG